MGNTARTVEDILKERLATIQEISETTAEHLRLTQKQAGMQVLDMSDAETPGVGGQMGRNEDALGRCEERIEGLERRLARLDAELETKVQGGET